MHPLLEEVAPLPRAQLQLHLATPLPGALLHLATPLPRALLRLAMPLPRAKVRAGARAR